MLFDGIYTTLTDGDWIFAGTKQFEKADWVANATRAGDQVIVTITVSSTQGDDVLYHRTVTGEMK